MNWNEFDGVAIKKYMDKVELPQFLKEQMNDGDIWDGVLDKYKKYLSITTPARSIQHVMMTDEQRNEIRDYINKVNDIIYGEVLPIVNKWLRTAPELTGSIKQIEWAKDLRQDALEFLATDFLRPFNERCLWHYMDSFIINMVSRAIEDPSPYEKYATEQKNFFGRLLSNFEEEFPELVPRSLSGKKYSTEEKRAAKELFYKKVADTVPTFNQSKVWIESREGNGCPLQLAAMRYLARGEKLQSNIISYWSLRWYEE